MLVSGDGEDLTDLGFTVVKPEFVLRVFPKGNLIEVS